MSGESEEGISIKLESEGDEQFVKANSIAFSSTAK